MSSKNTVLEKRLEKIKKIEKGVPIKINLMISTKKNRNIFNMNEPMTRITTMESSTERESTVAAESVTGSSSDKAMTERSSAGATELWTGSDGRDNEDVTTVRATSQLDEIVELSDRIRQALECPVCMEVNANLECHCPNGHVMCSPCLFQLSLRESMDFCPMCRSPMSLNSIGQLTANRMMFALAQVNVTCRYWKHGCRVLVCVKEMARHEADCRYWPDVRCLVTTCRWLGTYDSLYEHVRCEHPNSVARTEVSFCLSPHLWPLVVRVFYVCQTLDSSWFRVERIGTCRSYTRKNSRRHLFDLRRVISQTSGHLKYTFSV